MHKYVTIGYNTHTYSIQYRFTYWLQDGSGKSESSGEMADLSRTLHQVHHSSRGYGKVCDFRHPKEKAIGRIRS